MDTPHRGRHRGHRDSSGRCKSPPRRIGKSRWQKPADNAAGFQRCGRLRTSAARLKTQSGRHRSRPGQEIRRSEGSKRPTYRARSQRRSVAHLRRPPMSALRPPSGVMRTLSRHRRMTESDAVVQQCSICRSTHQTLIRSRCRSASSKHFCERSPSGLFVVCAGGSARSCQPSVARNVVITSDMPATRPYDRNLLYLRPAFVSTQIRFQTAAQRSA
jgi:hypothetical protein